MDNIEKTMESNRRYFVLEFLSGMSQFTLVTGAFLAGFVKMLGGSNSFNGLVATLPAVMGFFQIFSAMYFERLDRRKPALFAFAIVLRIMMALSFIVPALLTGGTVSLPLFAAIYCLTFAINAMVMPAQNDILIDSTPPSIRGRFFALREGVGFLIASALSFMLGRMLDGMKTDGLEAKGFFYIGIVVLIMGGANVFSVFKMKELGGAGRAAAYKLREVVTLPFRSKGFRRIMLMFILWNFGYQFGAPFVAVYLVADLEVSYTAMTLYGILTSIMRIIFPALWGRISDKKSWYLTVEASIALLAVSMLLWCLVDAGSVRWLAPLLFILTGFAWSGIGLSMFNIQYMYAKRAGRTMYIGLNAALGGVFSLLGVVLGGAVVNNAGMKTVFLISGIILLLCPVYVKFFVEPVPSEE